MRCQTPPVVSSAEYMEQIFCWKHDEDDLMNNHEDDEDNQPAERQAGRGESSVEQGEREEVVPLRQNRQ